jgi:RNA polymerase sigma factor (sigma-70 family)
MQPGDDSALLRDYCENQSPDAFAELVSRHINLVYSVALRYVGNPHQAEEITQAVFIILAKKAVSLRQDKALSSWLFQATHLTANNLIRSEARRHHREQEAYMQSLLNQPDAGVWRDIAPLLDTAVARLNEKDRRAIVLRFYEGRNLHEIGMALGGNEESAKKRVARALEKLRTYFLKRGVDSPTAAIAGVISANSVQTAPAGLAKAVSAVATAKGAAASTSTLTLIKGALKLMAWSKAKVAVAVAAGLILAGGASIVVVNKVSEARELIENGWIKNIVYYGDDKQLNVWRLRGQRGVRVLVRALQSPASDHSTRMCVASVLDQLANDPKGGGASSAVSGVLNQLKIEKDDSVRAIEFSFFSTPFKSMSEKEKAALLPELIRGLQSSDSAVRNNVLVALQYYTDQKEVVVPLIVNTLQDPVSGVRLMAAQALNQIDPQNPARTNLVTVVAGCITGPTGNMPGTPNEAVVFLGELHREPEVAVPVLIQSLESSNIYVRQNSAAALSRFGGQAKSAVPALTKALEDPNPNVRSWAKTALKRINANAPAK